MFNFEKEYIIQCIASAANNLRLSSEKIEIIALLRDFLNKASDINASINELKTTTAFSKLAIQLSSILFDLNKGKIDFMRVSERFRDDTLKIISETGRLLETTNPGEVSRTFEKLSLKSMQISVDKVCETHLPAPAVLDVKDEPIQEESSVEPERIEDAEEVKFDEFVNGILLPINEVEGVLTRIEIDDFEPDELTYYSELMLNNAEKSEELGFEIIAKMQYIFSDGLLLFRDGKLSNAKRTVELLRACMIVVVAIIRKKNVDLTNYIQQAENFGAEIKEIIRKDF